VSKPAVALATLVLLLGGCGDGTSEPEIRGPRTDEGRVEAFCAPLLFDPESSDPAGDLVRRAVAVVDNSGTGADADETAASFVQITDRAPTSIREPAAVLGDAVGEALGTGDRSAIETPDVERATREINEWAATTCPEPDATTTP